MIASIRQKFNTAFTEQSHQNYLAALNTAFPGALDFSVAETPIFINKDFTEKDELTQYMINNKTSCALKIMESNTIINIPDYIAHAIE